MDSESFRPRSGSDEAALEEYILELINKLSPEDKPMALRALTRYEREGAESTYSTEPQSLIQLIDDLRLLRNANWVGDLGAGPGDVVGALADKYPQLQVTGIDISPTFVAKFNRNKKRQNAGMAVGLIDQPLSIGADNRTAAISVLTLDRLVNPKMLIDNMAKFNAAKILATLLPIVAEDDNPSLQGTKNIYTAPEKRVVPGKNARDDRQELWKLLQRSWNSPVEFATVPYVVSSSGDRQEYELGVFFTS